MSCFKEGEIVMEEIYDPTNPSVQWVPRVYYKNCSYVKLRKLNLKEQGSKEKIILKEKPFYMIWNPGNKAPKKTHFNIESARTEVKRLAIANPGEKFYILKSILWAITPLNTIEYCNIYNEEE